MTELIVIKAADERDRRDGF